MAHWQSSPSSTIPNQETENVQPDIKFETAPYPADGVAPSTFVLAPYNYIQKIRARPRRG